MGRSGPRSGGSARADARAPDADSVSVRETTQVLRLLSGLREGRCVVSVCTPDSDELFNSALLDCRGGAEGLTLDELTGSLDVGGSVTAFTGTLVSGTIDVAGSVPAGQNVPSTAAAGDVASSLGNDDLEPASARN